MLYSFYERKRFLYQVIWGDYYGNKDTCQVFNDFLRVLSVVPTFHKWASVMKVFFFCDSFTLWMLSCCMTHHRVKGKNEDRAFFFSLTFDKGKWFSIIFSRCSGTQRLRVRGTARSACMDSCVCENNTAGGYSEEFSFKCCFCGALCTNKLLL